MKNSALLVEERRNRILDILREEKKVKVAQLSSQMKVSEITIRRDLDLLEKENLVMRFHGGAQILEDPGSSLPIFNKKQAANMAKKDCIGRKTAELIEDDDVVFMNSGTTVLCVLKYITSNNVRVITNNAMAPSVDCSSRVGVILTGGECGRDTKSLAGDFAMTTISKVYATKCILGANGISANAGITTSIHQETSINNMMLQRCVGKRIVVADSSKIGRSVDFVTADIDAIDCLVTDSEADPAEVRRLENLGIEVILVDVAPSVLAAAE